MFLRYMFYSPGYRLSCDKGKILDIGVVSEWSVVYLDTFMLWFVQWWIAPSQEVSFLLFFQISRLYCQCIKIVVIGRNVDCLKEIVLNGNVDLCLLSERECGFSKDTTYMIFARRKEKC